MSAKNEPTMRKRAEKLIDDLKKDNALLREQCAQQSIIITAMSSRFELIEEALHSASASLHVLSEDWRLTESHWRQQSAADAALCDSASKALSEVKALIDKAQASAKSEGKP